MWSAGALVALPQSGPAVPVELASSTPSLANEIQRRLVHRFEQYVVEFLLPQNV